MSLRLVAILAAAVFSLALVLILVIKLKARSKLPSKTKERWLEIQRLCASKETWSLAVINADKLLENVLKKKRIKGKSMGERLVAAQRVFSNNDGVWYAHNLAKKLLSDSAVTLREAEAKKSLFGIRQALRDLGILNDK